MQRLAEWPTGLCARWKVPGLEYESVFKRETNERETNVVASPDIVGYEPCYEVCVRGGK